MERIPYARTLAGLVLFKAMLILGLQGAPAAEHSGGGEVTEETREAKESMDLMQDLDYEERSEAAELVIAALVSIDRQIVALEEKLENLSEEAGEKKEGVLKQLLERREKLSARYQAFRDSSAEEWKKVKQSFLTAFDSLYRELVEAHEYIAERT